MSKLDFDVFLRAFELSDVDNTYLWHNDDDLSAEVIGRKYYVSKEYEKKWITDSIFSNQNVCKLAVCLKKTNTHIGNVYFNDIDYFNKCASSGILIGNKLYRGKGFGTKAYMLLLYYAFYDLGLNRVYSRLLYSNTASIRLHEKCGFSHEGVLRKAIFKNGSFQDLIMMSILRFEYDELLTQKII